MLRGEYKIGLIIGDDVGLMIGGVLGLIIGGVLALLIIGGVIGLLCGDGVEVGVKTGSYSSAKNCLTNLSLSTSSTEVWLARKPPHLPMHTFNNHLRLHIICKQIYIENYVVIGLVE